METIKELLVKLRTGQEITLKKPDLEDLELLGNLWEGRMHLANLTYLVENWYSDQSNGNDGDAKRYLHRIRLLCDSCSPGDYTSGLRPTDPMDASNLEYYIKELIEELPIEVQQELNKIKTVWYSFNGVIIRNITNEYKQTTSRIEIPGFHFFEHVADDDNLLDSAYDLGLAESVLAMYSKVYYYRYPKNGHRAGILNALSQAYQTITGERLDKPKCRQYKYSQQVPYQDTTLQVDIEYNLTQSDRMFWCNFTYWDRKAVSGRPGDGPFHTKQVLQSLSVELPAFDATGHLLMVLEK